eukprot:jgi/Botrbrau1/16145/Bobra.0281s0002.1
MWQGPCGPLQRKRAIAGEPGEARGERLAAVQRAVQAVQQGPLLQQLVEALLLAAAPAPDGGPQGTLDTAAETLSHILFGPSWDRTDVQFRFLLTEKLLLHKTLPPAAMQLLLRVLAAWDGRARPGETSAGTHGRRYRRPSFSCLVGCGCACPARPGVQLRRYNGSPRSNRRTSPPF